MGHHRKNVGKPKSPSNHPPTPKTAPYPICTLSNLPSCNISSEVNSVGKGEYAFSIAHIYLRVFGCVYLAVTLLRIWSALQSEGRSVGLGLLRFTLFFDQYMVRTTYWGTVNQLTGKCQPHTIAITNLPQCVYDSPLVEGQHEIQFPIIISMSIGI